MKKLLALIGALACFTVSAQQNYVTNSMAAGLRTIIPEAIVLESLQITGTSNTIVRIWDGPTTNVVGAYTNYTSFITNQVRTFVGVNGLTNNYTNTLLYTLAQATAAATNDVTPILVLNIGANTTPFVFSTPTVFTRGVNVSNNNGGLTMVVTYHQP